MPNTRNPWDRPPGYVPQRDWVDNAFDTLSTTDYVNTPPAPTGVEEIYVEPEYDGLDEEHEDDEILPEDLHYPELRSHGAQVRWDDRNAHFYLRVNDGYHTNDTHFATHDTIDFVYVLAQEFIRNRVINQVWPGTSSFEYRVLEGAQLRASSAGRTTGDIELDAFMNEATMPIDSRATPANDYSFVIEYSSRNGCYNIVAPHEMCERHDLSYADELVGDLTRAYETAFDYVRHCRSSSGIDDFNVWPRRNSNHYRALQNATRDVRAGNIRNYTRFIELCGEVHQDPTSVDNELYSQWMFQYLAASRQNGGYMSTSQYRSVLGEVQKLFKRLTGADWERSHDNDQALVFPGRNVVHDNNNNQSLTHVYTTHYWLRNTHSCSVCNERYNSSMTVRPSGDIRVCNFCLPDSGWVRCNLCENRYHSTEEGCPRVAEMPAGYIYGYNMDVRAAYPKMFHVPSDVQMNGNYLRYGVELEVLTRPEYNRDTSASEVGEAFKGHAILKHDSSLGRDGGGFEIVTVPATLEYHRKQLWNNFFKDTLERGHAPAQTVWSWNTKRCGIHVHITRACLDKMQLAKLLYFYHDPINGEFLSKIAGRRVGPDAQYCKAAKKKLRGNTTTGETTANDCNDHHDAITVSQRNRGKTVEVRIFRGNSSRHGVMRAIEFVDATVLWCRNNGAQELHYRKFLEWFDQQEIRSKYPDLWRHLLDMKYLLTPHKDGVIDQPIATNGKRRKLAHMTDAEKAA